MKGEDMEAMIQEYLDNGGKIKVLPSNEKPFIRTPKKPMKKAEECWVKRIMFGRCKLLVKVK
jgi:hypothetical protein